MFSDNSSFREAQLFPWEDWWRPYFWSILARAWRCWAWSSFETERKWKKNVKLTYYCVTSAAFGWCKNKIKQKLISIVFLGWVWLCCLSDVSFSCLRMMKPLGLKKKKKVPWWQLHIRQRQRWIWSSLILYILARSHRPNCQMWRARNKMQKERRLSGCFQLRRQSDCNCVTLCYWDLNIFYNQHYFQPAIDSVSMKT